MNRSFVVSRAEANQPLASVLRTRLGLAFAVASRLIVDRKVTLNESPCTDPNRRVRAGQRVLVQSEEKPRLATPEIVLRHVDNAIVVVDKPAGMTTMRHADEAKEFGSRGKRFLPQTLADQLPALLGAREGGMPSVRAVHRIDKETSGLVVFARTREAERNLGQQFRDHTIDRRYLALVRGKARPGRIESRLVRDRGDGRRGSGPEGERAVTHVAVVEELGEYTLVECSLETGRTHQVRIHLGEAGFPLCGERVYDRPLNGAPLPDGSGADRVMLHAATLGLEHPTTGKRRTWTSPLPPDMQAVLERLRAMRQKAPE